MSKTCKFGSDLASNQNVAQIFLDQLDFLRERGGNKKFWFVICISVNLCMPAKSAFLCLKESIKQSVMWQRCFPVEGAQFHNGRAQWDP